MATEVFETLQAAVSFPSTAVIVRTQAAIAEISGPLQLRQGGDWLTLGEDAGSHLHLRSADIECFRFSAAPSANAMLEVLGRDGTTLCKFSFRGTNPNKAERFDAALATAVTARFGHLKIAPPPHVSG